jgi:hypothetical protein
MAGRLIRQRNSRFGARSRYGALCADHFFYNQRTNFANRDQPGMLTAWPSESAITFGAAWALSQPGSDLFFRALRCVDSDSDIPLEIMMPVVKTEDDVLKIKKVIDEDAERAGIESSRYSFGVMIETLESCKNIAAIARHCDFISFGTNDPNI